MPKPRKTIFADPYIKIIGELQATRRKLGITQAELAEAYGEDQSFISRIERCQRRLDIHEYARICGLLDRDPGELLRPISDEALKSKLAKKGDSPYDRRGRRKRSNAGEGSMREAETVVLHEAEATIEALCSQISYRRTDTGGFEPPEITIPTADWHVIVSGLKEYYLLVENELPDDTSDDGEIDQYARAFKAVDEFNKNNLSSVSESRHPPEYITLPTRIWHELQLLSTDI